MTRDTTQLKHEITAFSKDGRISCAAALSLASKYQAEPAMVGEMIDELKISIELCQLGLFGYGPEKKKNIIEPDTIPSDISQWIEDAKSGVGYLTCADIFAKAKETSRSKALLAGACEKMELKIRACQIGAF